MLGVAIEKVDWSKLRAASGTAGNVPRHFEVIQAGEASARHHAVDALRRELIAPQRPSKAGLQLARLLVDGLSTSESEQWLERPRLIVLVVDLCLGGHHAYLERGVNRRDKTIKKKLARGLQRDGYKWLAEQCSVFARLLDDESPAVRSAATLALGFHDDAAAERRQLLQVRREVEEDHGVLASLLVAEGLLSGYLGEPMGSVKGEPKDGLVAAAAAIGRFYSGDTLDAELEGALAKAIQLAGVGDERFPFNEGVVDGLVGALLNGCGEEGREAHVRGLLQAIEVHGVNPQEKSPTYVYNWTQSAMRLGLARFELRAPKKSKEKVIPADVAESDLSEAEHALIAALSQHELSADFERFGLPPGAAERRRLLEIDPPQLLDRRVVIELQGSARSWPLWRLWLAPQRGEMSAAELRASVESLLGADELLQVMIRTAQGGYGIRGLVELDWFDEVARVSSDFAWAHELSAELALDPPPGRSRPLLMLLELVTGQGPLDESLDSLLPHMMFDREVGRVRAVLLQLPPQRCDRAIDAFMSLHEESRQLSAGAPFFDMCPSSRRAETLIAVLVEPGDMLVSPDAIAAALVSLGVDLALPLIERALSTSGKPVHAKQLKLAAKQLS